MTHTVIITIFRGFHLSIKNRTNLLQPKYEYSFHLTESCLRHQGNYKSHSHFLLTHILVTTRIPSHCREGEHKLNSFSFLLSFYIERVEHVCWWRIRVSYQLQIEFHVLVFEHGIHALHLKGDATLGVIQALDEVVPVLRHQVSETEECVRLSML